MRDEGQPTAEQFSAYQSLFDYFNKMLFNSELPPIILNFSRKANTCGFFAANRWRKGDNKTHEISINPAFLAQAPFREVCQTLVHEMCHLWQYSNGKPSRTGYHNKEWAKQMERIGLMPSDNGQPGGRRVGQAMSDYVIDEGPFEECFAVMPEAICLPWKATVVLERAESIPISIKEQGEIRTEEGGEPEIQEEDYLQGKKIKYSCPSESCKVNVWGKPGLNIVCGDCGARLEIKPPKVRNLGRLAAYLNREVRNVNNIVL